MRRMLEARRKRREVTAAASARGRRAFSRISNSNTNKRRVIFK
jgi:hypothetical protein